MRGGEGESDAERVSPRSSTASAYLLLFKLNKWSETSVHLYINLKFIVQCLSFGRSSGNLRGANGISREYELKALND